MDEFPARHDTEEVPEPAGGRRLAVAIVGAVVVLALTAYYYYGSGRSGPAPDEATALVTDARDTEVAVVPPADPAPADAVAAGAVVPPAAAAAPPVDIAERGGAEPAGIGHGQVVVRSTPSGALVTIDGRRAGVTPITVPDLAFGTHEVQVARPGFAPVAERVELTQAAPTRTLALALEPGVDAPALAEGALDVDSRPRGATVVIDGRPVGVTPLRLPSLAAGRHVVQLERPGYRSVRAEVTIEGGRSSRVAVTLEPDRR